jgi:hypothetical protein
LNKQGGATMVEFSLVLIIFLTFLLGILDFSRMLWTWNAAAEATRWGARISVVCYPDAPAVLNSMQRFLPQLTASNVVIDWYGADGTISSCDASNCAGVNVRIADLDYQWISPIGFRTLGAIPMPGFSTYLPRELMGQDPSSPTICE